MGLEGVQLLHWPRKVTTGCNSVRDAKCNLSCSLGATVHMVCRNPSRGEEAKQSIITESGNDVMLKKHIQKLE